MYAGSRPTSKLRTGRNPAAGWRTAESSSAGASDTDSWSREYKVIRGTIESEVEGGGSKEPIVTRDGFGENKDGRRGWWAGRRSGNVEKARRDGETGGRRWEIDACLLACLLASTTSKVEVGGRSSAQGRISSEELGVVW